MSVVIGIDPGLTGAIAVLGEAIEAYDMPVMAKGTGKKQQVNAAEVANILLCHQGAATVYLERVAAMPKQGVSSTFSFGETFGVMRGVTAALGIPLELVTPQSWKRRFSLLGADKDAARTKAIELFPEAPLSRKKDIGRAEALLIAVYGLELERQRGAA